MPPEPDIESEPISEADPMSLSSLWQRNGKVILLVVVITLTALTACSIVLDVFRPGGGRQILLVQLWIMTLVMPVAAHGAGRAMDVLYRAGVTNDAFGCFVLLLAFLGGPWGLPEAIKLYLLTSAAGLLLAGSFVALRSLALPGAVPTAVMAGIGLTLALCHTIAPAVGPEGANFLVRVNLVSAAADALGVQAGAVSWLVTCLIYGAAAGLCWSIPLVAGGRRAHEDDELK